MALGIDLLGSALVAILLACGGITAIVLGYKLYSKQLGTKIDSSTSAAGVKAQPSGLRGARIIGATLMLTSLGWGLLASTRYVVQDPLLLPRLLEEDRSRPRPLDWDGIPRFAFTCCEREPDTIVEETSAVGRVLREAQEAANADFGFDPSLGRIANKIRFRAWPGEFYRQATTLCADDPACDSALLLEVINCYQRFMVLHAVTVCNDTADCRATGRNPDDCVGTECESIFAPGLGDPLTLFPGGLVCEGSCLRWSGRGCR